MKRLPTGIVFFAGLLACCTILSMRSGSYVLAQQLSSSSSPGNQQESVSVSASQENDAYRRASFPKQGFQVSMPLDWSQREGNTFGPHLPTDTVSLGSSNGAFSVTIVSVNIGEDFPREVETFASTILGRFRWLTDYSELVFTQSELGLEESARLEYQEPAQKESPQVTVVSEFAVVGDRGYWLSTEYYSPRRTSSTLAYEDQQRLSTFDEIVESFSILNGDVDLETHLTQADWREVQLLAGSRREVRGVSAAFLWPSTGYVGYIYGRDDHNGVDIWTSRNCDSTSTNRGASVYAAAQGKLDYLYKIPDGVYDGVRIDHGTIGSSRIWTHYWHLGSLSPGAQQTSFVTGVIGSVTSESQIGNQGNLMRSGNSGAVKTTCVHVHVTVANGSADSNAIDPSPFFDTRLNWSDPSHVGWHFYVEHGSAPPTCSNPNADQVTLYVLGGFDGVNGQCVTKNIGEYLNSGSIGLPDNSIRSIKVGGNVRARLCTEPNLSGSCDWFGADNGDLNGSAVGYGTSSVKVETKPATPGAPSLASPSDGATIVEGNAITLSWNSAANANEYYGQINGGPTPMTFDWQSGTSKNIGAQWPGYEYSWRVKARNGAGESAYSSTWTFRVIPKAPSNVTATAKTCTSVEIGWTNNSSSLDGFRLYRNGSELGYVSANITSYTDNGLNEETSYSYTVRAVRNGIASNDSNTASVTTPGCPVTPPTSPTLQAPPSGKVFVEGETIVLSWNSSANATGYYGAVLDGPAPIAFGWQSALEKNLGALTPGYRYSWKVKARNDGGESDYSTARTFDVVPAAPANLVATAQSCTSVRLTWSDNSIAEDGFKIYRNGSEVGAVGTSGTTYTDELLHPQQSYNYTVKTHRNGFLSNATTASVTTPDCPVQPPQSPTIIEPHYGKEFVEGEAVFLSWENTPGATEYYGEVTSGPNLWPFGWQTSPYVYLGVQSPGYEYYWRVKARNSGGESTYTDKWMFRVLPKAPSNLSATALTCTSVKLTWTDNSTSENGYKIYDHGILEVGSVAANVTSFTLGVEGGTTYNYTVRAHRNGIFSHDATISGTTPDCPVQPPQSPVIIAPPMGRTFIEGELATLSWENLATATGYYGEVTGGPSPITFGWQPETSRALGVQPPGYEYSWRVKARNAGGESTYTGWWRFTVIPKAPTNTSASALSCNSVKVSWTDNSNSEDGYKIYRNTFEEVGSVGAGATSFTDTVQPRTTYTYTVKAYRNGFFSNAGTASVTTPDCPVQPPAAPVLVSPPSGQTFVEGESIVLTWNSVTDATGYFGNISGGPAQMTFGWQTGTSKTIGAQWPGYEYLWEVKARNGNVEGNYSNKWVFRVIPKKPANLSASVQSCSSVRLTWTDNSGSEDGYKIYRNGAEIGSVGAGGNTYTDQGLQEQTNYSYVVRAHRNGLNSEPSNVASITTARCNNDTTPPQVVWAEPVGDEESYAVSGETVTLKVTATDNLGVDSVRFWRWDHTTQQNVEIGMDSQAPYTALVDTGEFTNDWNEIFAQAMDRAGNASDSPYIWLYYEPDSGLGAPPLNAIDNPDGDGNYTVGWPEIGAATGYKLQEQYNSGSWSQAYNGSNTSVNRTNRSDGQWCYRVRAYNNSIQSDWSDIECVTVDPDIGPLPAPVLESISNPAHQSSYWVTWRPVNSAESYELQERYSSAAFVLAYSGPSTSVYRLDKSQGQWCYRVRAVGPSGPGDWSQTLCTTVDSASGPYKFFIPTVID